MPTPDMLSTQKIEHRIKIAAASASCSVIAVRISKDVAMVKTNLLMEKDGDSE